MPAATLFSGACRRLSPLQHHCSSCRSAWLGLAAARACSSRRVYARAGHSGGLSAGNNSSSTDSSSGGSSGGDGTGAGSSEGFGARPTLSNYKLVVAYDGTNFHGFQMQPTRVTVQQRLEQVLTKVTREPRESLKLLCAGRTDAGVHAVGQVASFHTFRDDVTPALLMKALNAQLPKDIRLLSATRVPPDFHARFSALSKVYRFDLHTERVESPFTHRTRMHVPWPLDLELLRHGAAMFEGQHDFTQFSNLNAAAKINPNKTIHEFSLHEIDEGLRFRVHGSGFLYRQVRHMVGALLMLGQGRISPDRVEELLQMGSSQPIPSGYRGWSAAEARGLCLESVEYPPGENFPDTLMHPEARHDKFGRITASLPRPPPPPPPPTPPTAPPLGDCEAAPADAAPAEPSRVPAVAA